MYMASGLSDQAGVENIPRKRPQKTVQKTPVFNDPMSALAAYLPKGGKLDIQFNDISTKLEPQFEASLTLNGITYKGSGGNKKEAKQKMAVVILREKFSLDATELLQTYAMQSGNVQNKKFKMGPGSAVKMESNIPAAQNSFDCDSTIFSDDFDPSVCNEASFSIREHHFNQNIGNGGQQFSGNLGVHQRIGPNVDNRMQRNAMGLSAPMRGPLHQRQLTMDSYQRIPTAPQPRQQLYSAPIAAQTCSIEDVRFLLNENHMLRLENDSLKAKLAQVSVHSRLGVPQAVKEEAKTPAEKADFIDKFNEFINNQPTVEPRESAVEELRALKESNKDDFTYSMKKCVSPFPNIQFSLCAIRTPSVLGAANFYGKGESKHAANMHAVTLAVDFLKRVLQGEKIIPFNVAPTMYLNIILAGQEKKPSECYSVSPDEASGTFQAKIVLDNYEGVEFGASKKEAKEKVALKVLKESLGYVTYS